MFDGLLFDKDGTLFHFEQSWAGLFRACLDRVSGGDAELHARLARESGFEPKSGRFEPDSPLIAQSGAQNAELWARHLPHMTAREVRRWSPFWACR